MCMGKASSAKKKRHETVIIGIILSICCHKVLMVLSLELTPSLMPGQRDIMKRLNTESFHPNCLENIFVLLQWLRELN